MLLARQYHLINDVWQRLRLNKKLAPRNYVLAAIYMLHIETWYPNLKPQSSDGTVMISEEREAILACFGEWVNCQCRPFCTWEWCFSRSRTGMYKIKMPSPCLVYKRDEEAMLRTEKLWNERRQQPMPMP
jgi:hypothetical protein